VRDQLDLKEVVIKEEQELLRERTAQLKAHAEKQRSELETQVGVVCGSRYGVRWILPV
jgi:hypothetical protein